MFSCVNCIDLLIGLFNCRGLQQVLDVLQVQGILFVILVLDIDCFKLINDSYGYDVGDVVIVYIFDQMCCYLCDSDIFCCVGGEEFLLLLLGISIDLVCQVGECLCQYIVDYLFVLVGIIIVLLGVVYFFSFYVDVEQVLWLVDKVLYMVKEQGCNCVVVYLYVD